MKILHVCAYLYPALQYGGPAKVVYDLAKEQSRRDSVTVLTSDVWNEKRRIRTTEKLKSSTQFSVVYTKNIYNKIAYTQRLFTCFGMVGFALRNLRSYAVIHIHDVFIIPQLVVGYIALVLQKKVIISPHGILDPVRMQKKTLLKNILYTTLAQPLLRRADYLIATSDKEKHDLEELGFGRVKTVWNGVPHRKTLSKHTRRSGKLLGLYIGKLHPQKGLQELVQAAQPFQAQLALLLAGPDDGVKDELKRLDHAQMVQFTGFVSDAQKDFLYSQADFFVYPSHAEGFSISILEALQAELPVVITTECNFPLVAEYAAGIVVPVENLVAELHTILSQLVQNPSLLSTFRSRTTQLIREHFTMEHMASELRKIYATHS